MRVLYIIVLIFVSFACKTNKYIETENKLVKSNNICPEDGICTFNVIKNKVYSIKTDKFGNSYSELLEGKNTVLKFEYKRNEQDGIQDSSYKEIIYIEINSNELNITDLNLKNTTVGFERLCFCRGQTGAYSVLEGILILTKIREKEYNLVLNFKIKEVSQIITAINENFEL